MDAPVGRDALSPDAGYVTTRAGTVKAPVEAVWPWLVQMGQDRAGFYTHNWVERLLHSGIPDIAEVHPEWQHIEVGDLMRTNHDIGGRPMGWPVVAVDPGARRTSVRTTPCVTWSKWSRSSGRSPASRGMPSP